MQSRKNMSVYIYTYMQLTFMLHNRIHGFLLTEFSVRKMIQNYVFRVRATMKHR